MEKISGNMRDKIVLTGGSTHKTYSVRDTVVQELNPKLPVPSKEFVNEVVGVLKRNGIMAAKVIRQTKKERVFEKIDAEFYDFFTPEQVVKATKFMLKLHEAIQGIIPVSRFYLVEEFNTFLDFYPKVIWGDMKTNNIAWKNGKPIGMVDYDSIGYSSEMFDVCTAIVTWSKNFDIRIVDIVIENYFPKASSFHRNYLLRCLKYFILIRYKQLTRRLLAKETSKKEKKLTIEKLKRLEIYDKSFIWGSL